MMNGFYGNYAPSIAFAVLASIPLGSRASLLIFLTSVALQLWYQKKKLIFTASAAATIVWGIGGLEYYLMHSFKRYPVAGFQSYQDIFPHVLLSVLAVGVFSYWYIQKLKRLRMFILITVLSVAGVGPNLVTEPHAVVLLRCLTYVLFSHAWHLLIEGHHSNAVPRIPIANRFQFWTFTYKTPIPLPLMLAHEVTRERLTETQWKAVKLLAFTMIAHIAYRTMEYLVAHSRLPMNLYEFFGSRPGIGLEGALSLQNRVGGIGGLILMISYAGIGIVIYISIQLGYLVSILRSVGYDMPANINTGIFRFTDFNSFLRSAYFYYSYAMMHGVMPSVKSTYRTLLPKRSARTKTTLSIFTTILFGGLLFHFIGSLGSKGLSGLPYLAQASAKPLVVIALYYVAMAGLITFVFIQNRHSQKRSCHRIRLALRRIGILLLFFLLIVPKSLMSHLDEPTIIDRIKQVFGPNQQQSK